MALHHLVGEKSNIHSQGCSLQYQVRRKMYLHICRNFPSFGCGKFRHYLAVLFFRNNESRIETFKKFLSATSSLTNRHGCHPHFLLTSSALFCDVIRFILQRHPPVIMTRSASNCDVILLSLGRHPHVIVT